MSESQAATSAARHQSGGNFLCLCVGETRCALEIVAVREIVGFAQIEAALKPTEFVNRSIRVHGRRIPVFDLREALALPRGPRAAEACVLVVETSHRGQKSSAGLLIDEVGQTLAIAANEIQPVGQRFISGKCEINATPTLLLDVQQILASIEPHEIQQHAAA